jgi:TfoX/Sxy family transcriptional regulator of competence genes
MDRSLIKKIMTSMAAIGKVEYRMHDKFIGLYRDGMLFAKIHAEKLYLVNNGVLVKVDHSLDPVLKVI